MTQDDPDGQQTAEFLEQLAPLIPAENRHKAELILAQISQTTTRHSGPLPPARELASYKAIDASFAERIMQMAEREQAMRHAMPSEFMKREYTLKARGQHYALALAICILLFAAYLAYLGDTAVAGRVAIGTLVGIVSIFVIGKATEAYGERGVDDKPE
ncbi:DUF2335 domain-containing protein [Sphingomonas parapaucimobilis]|uniref:DUF2335 domain-containing protein n=1 Tax=Sphingomonas parapaucimobilis TaxID=28213 RepID=UPI003EE921C4